MLPNSVMFWDKTYPMYTCTHNRRSKHGHIVGYIGAIEGGYGPKFSTMFRFCCVRLYSDLSKWYHSTQRCLQLGYIEGPRKEVWPHGKEGRNMKEIMEKMYEIFDVDTPRPWLNKMTVTEVLNMLDLANSGANLKHTGEALQRLTGQDHPVSSRGEMVYWLPPFRDSDGCEICKKLEDGFDWGVPQELWRDTMGLREIASYCGVDYYDSIFVREYMRQKTGRTRAGKYGYFVPPLTREIPDDAAEMIEDAFDWDSYTRLHMTATEVCTYCGLNHPSQKELKRVGRILREHYGVEVKRYAGQRVYLMPPPM